MKELVWLVLLYVACGLIYAAARGNKDEESIALGIAFWPFCLACNLAKWTLGALVAATFFLRGGKQ